MKKSFWLILCCTICLSWLPLQAEHTKKLQITTTIVPLQYLIERVGQQFVTVSVMVNANADPHSYEPRPSQLVALAQTELYVKLGAPLEFEVNWLPKFQALNKAMVIGDSGKGLRLLAQGKHKCSSGTHCQHESSLDAHIWLSPNNLIIMVANIRDLLSKMDPVHKDEYVSNASQLILEISATKQAINRNLQALTQRKFLVFHPSWGYFARDFNLEQIAVEVNGQEPGARELASVINLARQENIRVVFASPPFSQKSVQMIATEINGRVLVINTLTKDILKNMTDIGLTLKAIKHEE